MSNTGQRAGYVALAYSTAFDIQGLVLSLNLFTTFVHMAKNFWPDHPLLYPTLTTVLCDQ